MAKRVIVEGTHEGVETLSSHARGASSFRIVPFKARLGAQIDWIGYAELMVGASFPRLADAWKSTCSPRLSFL